MSPKRVLTLGAGLVLVALACGLTTRWVAADIRPSESHMIGFSLGAGNVWALRSDGTVWTIDSSGWVMATPVGPNFLVPVPVEEVLFFDFPNVVSSGGELWRYSPGEPFPWHSLGVLPLPPGVRVEAQSWSQTKKKFDRR